MHGYQHKILAGRDITVFIENIAYRERSGRVLDSRPRGRVECLTRDRGAAGSSLTSVTAMCL